MEFNKVDVNSTNGLNKPNLSDTKKANTYFGALRYENDTVELSTKNKKPTSFADKIIGILKGGQNQNNAQTPENIKSGAETNNVSFKGSVSETSSNKPLGPMEAAKELFNTAYYKESNNYYPNALSTSDFLEKFTDLMPDDTTDFDKNHFDYVAEIFKNINKKAFGNTTITHRGYAQYYEKILDDIIYLSDTTIRKNGETAKTFMQRVCLEYNEQLKKETAGKKEKLSSLKYDPYDFSTPKEEKIFLSEQEKIELVDKLNKNRPGAELSYDDSMEKIANEWRYSYMGAGVPLYNQSAQDAKYANACLQELPRYELKKGESSTRWMGLYGPGELEHYIDSIPNEGEEFTFDRLQSFSKDNLVAETEFRDDNPDKNIKIVVCPKRRISQARDMGQSHKYGANEVVYPKGSKFKVIHKAWEEGSCNRGSFPRYCIYLQEE